MDEREIERATRRWHKAGVIDAQTAAEIRSIEEHRTESDRERRIATVVALMGAGLIGAGLLVYLATQWETLGRTLQTGVLIGIPGVLARLALELTRRDNRRVGSAIWLLTAVSVGPATLLLTELYWPEVAIYWPLIVWGAIVVPLGLIRESSLISGLGLGTLLLAVGTAAEGETGLFVAGLLGTVILASAITQERGDSGHTAAYWILGLGVPLIPLLWMAIEQSSIQWMAITWDGFLAAGLLVSLGGIGIMWHWYRAGRTTRKTVGAVSIPFIASSASLVLIAIASALPDVVVVIGIHSLLLGTLLAIASVGSYLRSRALINLVALGFLLQVLTILATITDTLSGAVTLIVSGSILVVVAIGIERGRRRLLSRF